MPQDSQGRSYVPISESYKPPAWLKLPREQLHLNDAGELFNIEGGYIYQVPEFDPETTIQDRQQNNYFKVPEDRKLPEWMDAFRGQLYRNDADKLFLYDDADGSIRQMPDEDPLAMPRKLKLNSGITWSRAEPSDIPKWLSDFPAENLYSNGKGGLFYVTIGDDGKFVSEPVPDDDPFSKEALKGYDQSAAGAFGAQFMQGLTDFVPSSLESSALLKAQLTKPSRLADGGQGLAMRLGKVKPLDEYQAEMDRWLEKNRDITSNDLYQLGKKVRKGIEDAFPVEPHRREEFITEFGGGLGNMASLLAVMAGTGGVAGLASKAGTKIIGRVAAPKLIATGAGASAMYSLGNAHNFDEALKQGASLEESLDYGMAGGLIETATESVAMKWMFNLIGRTLGPRKAKDITLRVAEATAVNTVQEALAEVLNNMAPHVLEIDELKKEDVLENAARAAQIGGAVGMTVQGMAELLAGMYNRKRRRGDFKAGQERPREPPELTPAGEEVEEPVQAKAQEQPAQAEKAPEAKIEDYENMSPAEKIRYTDYLRENDPDRLYALLREIEARRAQKEATAPPPAEPIADPAGVAEAVEFTLADLVGEQVNMGGEKNGRIVRKPWGERQAFYFRPDWAEKEEGDIFLSENDRSSEQFSLVKGHIHEVDRSEQAAQVEESAEPSPAETPQPQATEAKSERASRSPTAQDEEHEVPDRRSEAVHGKQGSEEQAREGHDGQLEQDQGELIERAEVAGGREERPPAAKRKAAPKKKAKPKRKAPVKRKPVAEVKPKPAEGAVREYAVAFERKAKEMTRRSKEEGEAGEAAFWKWDEAALEEEEKRGYTRLADNTELDAYMFGEEPYKGQPMLPPDMAEQAKKEGGDYMRKFFEEGKDYAETSEGIFLDNKRIQAKIDAVREAVERAKSKVPAKKKKPARAKGYIVQRPAGEYLLDTPDNTGLGEVSLTPDAKKAKVFATKKAATEARKAVAKGERGWKILGPDGKDIRRSELEEGEPAFTDLGFLAGDSTYDQVAAQRARNREYNRRRFEHEYEEIGIKGRDQIRHGQEAVREEILRKPMTRADVVDELKRDFGAKGIDGMMKQGVLNVMSKAEVEERYFHDVGDINGKKFTRGFVDPARGKIVLIHDHIDRSSLKGIFLHEVGVHYGLRNMLGENEFGRVLEQVRTRKGGAWSDARFRATMSYRDSEINPRVVDEEILAYFIQHNPNMPLTKRIIARVRAFLRKLGLVRGYTDADLREMVYRSAFLAARGRLPSTAENMDILFSKLDRDFDEEMETAGPKGKPPDVGVGDIRDRLHEWAARGQKLGWSKRVISRVRQVKSAVFESRLGILNTDMIIELMDIYGYSKIAKHRLMRNITDARSRVSEYFERVSRVTVKIDSFAKRAQKDPESKEQYRTLIELQRIATLAGYDPDRNKGSGGKYADNDMVETARDLWSKLGRDAKALYRLQRDMSEGLSKEMLAQMKSKIRRVVKDKKDAKRLIAEVNNRFEQANVYPYFALPHFGTYWVQGELPESVDADWMLTPDRVRNYSYNSRQERDRTKQMLRESGFVNISTGKKEEAAQEDSPAAQDRAQSFAVQAIGFLADKLDEGEFNRLKGDLQNMFLRTLPEYDLRRQMFSHRSGPRGYSEDLAKNFSVRSHQMAALISKIEYQDEIYRSFDIMDKGLKYVTNEKYRARVDGGKEDVTIADVIKEEAKGMARNPDGVRTYLTELKERMNVTWDINDFNVVSGLLRFTFGWRMSSPATWIQNSLQTPLWTTNFVGSRLGYGNSARQFTRAYREFITGVQADEVLEGEVKRYSSIEPHLTDPQEQEALRRLKGMNLYQSTYASMALGRHEEGFSTTTAVDQFFTHPFSWVERLNREVSFMAAYRAFKDAYFRREGILSNVGELTPAQLELQAIDFGEEAVRWTHLDYALANRPQYMRKSQIIRLFTQFWMYWTGMTQKLYLMYEGSVNSKAFAHLPPERRADMKRAVRREFVFGSVAGLGLMGVRGFLPMTIGLGLTSFIVNLFYEDDDETELMDDLDAYVTESAGPYWSAVMMRGLLDWMTGSAIGQRVSTANLMPPMVAKFIEAAPSTPALRRFENATMSAMGASVGIVTDILMGLKLIAEGQTWKGLEKMQPGTTKGAMRAIRVWMDEGRYTQSRGADIAGREFEGSDYLLLGLGLYPDWLQRGFDEMMARGRKESSVMKTRTRLLKPYRENRKKPWEVIRDPEIAEYNKRQPKNRITPATARASRRGAISAEKHRMAGRQVRSERGKAFPALVPPAP